MDEDIEAETGQDGVLELGVVVHDDRHDADIGEEAAGTPDHVLKSGDGEGRVVDRGLGGRIKSTDVQSKEYRGSE